MSAGVRDLSALFGARLALMLADLEALVLRESPSSERGR